MKKLIEKIITNKQLSLEEVNKFIESYIEHKKGKLPSANEIAGVIRLLQERVFDLIYAAKEYAKDLGLVIVEVQDLRTGKILKININEEVFTKNIN